MTKSPKYKLKLKWRLKIKANSKKYSKVVKQIENTYLAVQNNSAIPPHQHNFNQIIESLSFLVHVNGHKSNYKMCKMLLTWKYIRYDNILVNNIYYILVIIL